MSTSSATSLRELVAAHFQSNWNRTSLAALGLDLPIYVDDGTPIHDQADEICPLSFPDQSGFNPSNGDHTSPFTVQEVEGQGGRMGTGYFEITFDGAPEGYSVEVAGSDFSTLTVVGESVLSSATMRSVLAEQYADAFLAIGRKACIKIPGSDTSDLSDAIRQLGQDVPTNYPVKVPTPEGAPRRRQTVIIFETRKG